MKDLSNSFSTLDIREIRIEERQGAVLCLDCAFSAVGESEEQRA